MKKKGLFLGLTTIDIQYFIETFPASNAKVKTLPPEILAGGPACNAAVAFAHLNGDAQLISIVGEHSFKESVFSDLNQNKVTIIDAAEGQNIPPVIASVITSVKTGDRNIFTHSPPTINNHLISDNYLKTLDVEFLLIDGFYPEIAIPGVQQAKKKNIPVIADCGSWKPQYNELLPYVNYAICSNDFHPPGVQNSKDVFEFLSSKGIKNIAITRGEKSILWKSGKEIKEIQTPDVKVIDTLGAGDFFHGAFCHYFSIMKKFETALEKSSLVASKSCEHKGTRRWLKYVK